MKMKKYTSLLLALVFALLPFASAFAEETDDVIEPEDVLSVAISTDKESYKYLDTVVVTVTVTNISEDITASGVHSGAHGTGILPVKGEKVFENTDFLAPGESYSYSFRAVLTDKSANLNFFQRLILAIRGLFVKTAQFPLTGINPKYTVNASGKFMIAGNEAQISAYALYNGDC